MHNTPEVSDEATSPAALAKRLLNTPISHCFFCHGTGDALDHATLGLGGARPRAKSMARHCRRPGACLTATYGRRGREFYLQPGARRVRTQYESEAIARGWVTHKITGCSATIHRCGSARRNPRNTQASHWRVARLRLTTRAPENLRKWLMQGSTLA
jgi:hypothetical protein